MLYAGSLVFSPPTRPVDLCDWGQWWQFLKGRPVHVTDVLAFENGFLSEMLLGQGYNSYAVGKWHLTPAEQPQASFNWNEGGNARGWDA